MTVIQPVVLRLDRDRRQAADLYRDSDLHGLAVSQPTLSSPYPIKAWTALGCSLVLSLLAYGLITGTVAMGGWVIAHECGHHAFHRNRRVEAVVGFVLHSLLLVPYFSWQRSHAVHHAHCNHLEGGETHVPPRAESSTGRLILAMDRRMGRVLTGLRALVIHLLLGWPVYLLLGVTGGSDYGAPTSHFWPGAPFGNGERQLFPDSFRGSMLRSTLGVLAMLVLLGLAAMQSSLARVLCVYGLPYLVINAWLVAYTWLHHTDLDILHFASGDWTWAKGALQTVDRPYGPVLNFLHNGIGATHVCHHINPCIPHYNAWRDTTPPPSMRRCGGLPPTARWCARQDLVKVSFIRLERSLSGAGFLRQAWTRAAGQDP